MDARDPSEPGLLRSRFFWNLFASFAAVLLAVGLVLLVRFRVSSTWLILGGAFAGWLGHALG